MTAVVFADACYANESTSHKRNRTKASYACNVTQIVCLLRRQKDPTMSQVLSPVDLLLKDLRFENGGAKLVSCSGRHLTAKCLCVEAAVCGHKKFFESRRMIYSYFDFGINNSSFRLPYQRPSSSADCAREFKGSNGSASLVDRTRKKILGLRGADFLRMTL